MTEWFSQWFGHDYLELYPHRDERDARRAISLLARTVPLEGLRVLDLACGPGRHLAPLTGHGANPIGIDLSAALLRRARHTSPGALLVRGDMRSLPFRPASFDVVVNLFTSFGYFEDDEQHDGVIHAIADLLKPNGVFVIDYLNADQVQASLRPSEERHLNGRHVAIERRISADRRHVIKEMRLLDGNTKHVERVRLYTPDDLTAMLARVGLSMVARFGDYNGAPLDTDSPRAVLFSRKPHSVR